MFPRRETGIVNGLLIRVVSDPNKLKEIQPCENGGLFAFCNHDIIDRLSLAGVHYLYFSRHCAKGVCFRKFHTHGNGCSICTQSFPLAVYEHRNGYRKRKDQFPEFQASIYVTRKLHVWKLHMWKRADDLLETG